MNYTCDIIINKPIEEVYSLFDNPDNLKYWQPGFVSIEYLEGHQGEQGARSRINYQVGKRKITLTETIIKRSPPSEFTGNYDTSGMRTEIQNKFVALDPTTTKYISVNKIEFTGVMKIIGWLFKGKIKKEYRKIQADFKAFAEK